MILAAAPCLSPLGKNVAARRIKIQPESDVDADADADDNTPSSASPLLPSAVWPKTMTYLRLSEQMGLAKVSRQLLNEVPPLVGSGEEECDFVVYDADEMKEDVSPHVVAQFKEVLPSGLVLRRRGNPLPSASAEQTLSLSTFLPPSADDLICFLMPPGTRALWWQLAAVPACSCGEARLSGLFASKSPENNPQIALLARCLNPLVLLSKAVVGWLLRGGFGALRRAAQVLKLGI